MINNFQEDSQNKRINLKQLIKNAISSENQEIR